MSVRQDNENKNCRNRGLGIAAAAIGVGVGAALYYFFSKREEPDNEGATTSGWNCEPHPLSDSSFTTVSEHSTTDTSMNEISDESNSSVSSTSSESFVVLQNSSSESDNSSSESDNSSSESDNSSTESRNSSDSNLETSMTEFDSSVTQLDSSVTQLDSSVTQLDSSVTQLDSSMTDLSANQAFSSFYTSVDSETGTEWDVTNSSIDVPRERRRGVATMLFSVLLNGVRRPQTRHRDRTWAPEECAICFDMMNTQQNVMTLPCTHRFHQNCILCWLQEKQTCPVCRKEA